MSFATSCTKKCQVSMTLKTNFNPKVYPLPRIWVWARLHTPGCFPKRNVTGPDPEGTKATTLSSQLFLRSFGHERYERGTGGQGWARRGRGWGAKMSCRELAATRVVSPIMSETPQVMRKVRTSGTCGTCGRGRTKEPGPGGSVDNATKTRCLIPICSATVALSRASFSETTRLLACGAWGYGCDSETSWSKRMRNSSGQSHPPEHNDAAA